MCRHRKHPAPNDGTFMIINGQNYPITGVRVHDFQQDGAGAWQWVAAIYLSRETNASVTSLPSSPDHAVWVDAVRCLQNGDVLVVEENSALVVPAGEILQFLIKGSPEAPLPGVLDPEMEIEEERDS